jgi:hypothetical protein
VGVEVGWGRVKGTGRGRSRSRTDNDGTQNRACYEM